MKEFGELQFRNLEAAQRLSRLSVEHTLRITALLAELARELFELNRRQVGELAAADAAAVVQLRLKHARQTAEKMIGSARRVAEIGNETRVAFSRLLTEQLASGNHGAMDAFQAFFAVLPAQNVDMLGMLQLAMERSDRAFGDLDAIIADTARPAAPAGKPQAAPRRKAPTLPSPAADAAAVADASIA